MIDIKDICEKACLIAREAGSFIKEQFPKFDTNKIEYKGVHDFVSFVDKEAEKIIVTGLKKILPEAEFLVEENTVEFKKSEYYWIVDPLDGTTNFVHGLAPFSVSIALVKNDEIIIGVIYEVSANECFYAWKDGPAMLNNKVIKVSNNKKLTDSLIATGFPYYDYDRIKPFMKTLEFFFNETHGVRRLGSAATDLAYVACGRFEAFYEYSLHPWDVAAGIIIVKQAGGMVSDFKGGNNYLFGKEIIATNKHIFNDFFNIVNKEMS